MQKKNPHIFLHKLCKSFSWVRCCFPDYFDQPKYVPNHGEFSVFSSVGRGNLGNYSKLRRSFDTVLCRKIWGFFYTLPREIWLSITKVMNDLTGSGNLWTQLFWPRDWPPWYSFMIWIFLNSLIYEQNLARFLIPALICFSKLCTWLFQNFMGIGGGGF